MLSCELPHCTSWSELDQSETNRLLLQLPCHFLALHCIALHCIALHWMIARPLRCTEVITRYGYSCKEWPLSGHSLTWWHNHEVICRAKSQLCAFAGLGRLSRQTGAAALQHRRRESLGSSSSAAQPELGREPNPGSGSHTRPGGQPATAADSGCERQPLVPSTQLQASNCLLLHCALLFLCGIDISPELSTAGWSYSCHTTSDLSRRIQMHRLAAFTPT